MQEAASNELNNPMANRDPRSEGNELPPSGTAGVKEKTAAIIEKIGSAISPVLWLGMISGILLALLVFLNAQTLREWGMALLPESTAREVYPRPDLSGLKKDVGQLEQKVLQTRRRLTFFTPKDPYLIVDTSDNEYFLMTGNNIIRWGICSTGSYTLLKASEKQQWIFQTPRGMYRIRGKLEAPIWKKPDWAFIEEGLPVPPPNASERFESGVLGEYALEIGQGYLIHGTLYKRFLGMAVTHGCVRLDDEDLHSVYTNLQIGSKVFIY